MKYFSLLNSAKCRSNDGTMNALPKQIHKNCMPYLETEISILQPDIIWLQGVMVGDLFRVGPEGLCWFTELSEHEADRGEAEECEGLA